MSRQNEEHSYVPKDVLEQVRRIINKSDASSLQDVSIELDDTAEDVLRKVNDAFVASYENFSRPDSEEDIRKVLNASRIAVVPGVVSIDEDWTHVAITYIDVDEAIKGNAVMAVVGSAWYAVTKVAIPCPASMSDDTEYEEDDFIIGDGSEPEWEEDNEYQGLYSEFLTAATTLTMTGFEVLYLEAEEKTYDMVDGDIEKAISVRTRVFDPSMPTPSNISVVNLVEFQKKPNELVKLLSESQETSDGQPSSG